MEPTPSSPSAEPRTFQEAFCRRHRCAPESFSKLVLRRSFPPWVRPLGSLVLAVRPTLFRRELALIHRLGTANAGEAGLRAELDSYVYENERDKPFRVVSLGLRLSRRRFLRVYRAAMAGGTGASLASASPRTP